MPQRSAAPAAEHATTNGRLRHVVPWPAPETPRLEVMTITPEIAIEWLNANTKNRPVRESRVLDYARQMQEGRWKVNGESIKWSKEGRLLDGQHRLYACIEAGVSFRSAVVFGLDEAVFATLDRGGKRTAGDNLALLGEANADLIAAALKKLIQMRRGVLFGYGPTAQVAPEEVIEALDRHPEIRRSVPFARKVGRLAPPSLTIFLHFLFAQVDKPLADWFMDALGSGVGLRATDGVYQLRKRLEFNLISKAKLPEKEIAALFIKAWNAHRAGRKVSSLRWRNAGDKPEAFPEIQ